MLSKCAMSCGAWQIFCSVVVFLNNAAIDYGLCAPHIALHLAEHLPQAEVVMIPRSGQMVALEAPTTVNNALSQFWQQVEHATGQHPALASQTRV